MPFSHLLLAFVVVFIWGTNFVIIKWGLADFPPFLMSALRFLLSAIPWVFFLPRPAVSWRIMAGVGVLLGAGQFGTMYWTMQHNISPGVASLVIQAQVFFTILLSMMLTGERLTSAQWLALALAIAGYALVGWHSATDAASSVTLLGLGLVLFAAFCWGCANTLVRQAGRTNMLAFTAWSSLYAVPPVMGLSLLLDSPGAVMQALTHGSLVGWLAVWWQALGNTTLAFGAWYWLLSRHPTATVAPVALLVPVFGMLSSAWLMDESLPGWKVWAAVLVLGGLALNLQASRRINVKKAV